MSAVAAPVATTVDTSFVALVTVVALAATDDFVSAHLGSSDVTVDIIFVAVVAVAAVSAAADISVAANVSGAVPLLTRLWL